MATSYYTHPFGLLGPTLETARRTPFFGWFHFEETERQAKAPGELVQFRPSGEKFGDLCHLDALTTAKGGLVCIDLVVRRAFIDGRDSLFAQDLVKSFLNSALPDACRDLLAEFMEEINRPGAAGWTPGYLVFHGRRGAWDVVTGWSRIGLTNLVADGAPSLVVHVEPNPEAPNAEPVK